MDNPLEVARYLGKCQGAKLKIYQDLDEVNKRLPHFRVLRDGSIEIFNYTAHDNADRLPFFANYLARNVFPHVQLSKVTGYYNIELHDTYSYLPKTDDYGNVLVWSKRKADQHVILVPDLYQLANYGNKLDKQDTMSWEDKKDKVAFFGTTTGSRDPLTNERMRWCMWAKDRRDITDMYITKVAQIPIERIKADIPKFHEISYPPVTPEYTWNYKFLLDIPGNTCSWDRVPMIMNTRSLMLKTSCRDMCWYYPLLHNKEHYVHVGMQDMSGVREYYLANKKEAELITQTANVFVNNYLHALTAREYLVGMFEAAGDVNGR